MNDLDLRNHIVSEMEYTAGLDAAHIGVAVDNGVVTLFGHVPSFLQRVAAELAAQRIRGVKAIAQEINVRLPDEKKTDDDEIAARAVKILEWNDALPGRDVQVKVEKGCIILSGEVKTRLQRDVAESAVRQLSGVVGISNLIKVRPHVEAADVKRSVEAALERSAGLEAERIEVKTEGGKVELRGRVRNFQQRVLARRAAWNSPHVEVVDDNLTVG